MSTIALNCDDCIFAGNMESSGKDQLSKGLIVLMAVCTGLIVANIYYCQPLIVLISKGFGIPESKAGQVAFFTQAGYALGLLFFVPLGDKVERKSQIVWMTASAVVCLSFAALSPNLLCLEIASLLIGASSVIPQLILPLAAYLASPARTGKVIGTIMSGLLVGILLSRTLSCRSQLYPAADHAEGFSQERTCFFRVLCLADAEPGHAGAGAACSKGGGFDQCVGVCYFRHVLDHDGAAPGGASFSF
jgi:hypothetical protein